MKKGIIVSAALALAAGSARGDGDGAFTNSLGMRMMRVEPGTFMMGDTPGPDCLKPGDTHYDGPHWDEAPKHKVVIGKPFHMAAATSPVCKPPTA